METFVGFAIGYYVGSQLGREGLDRALEAVKTIVKSPEFGNLGSAAMQMGSGVLKQVMSEAPGLLTGKLASGLADRAKEALGGGGLRRVV